MKKILRKVCTHILNVHHHGIHLNGSKRSRIVSKTLLFLKLKCCFHHHRHFHCQSQSFQIKMNAGGKKYSTIFYEKCKTEKCQPKHSCVELYNGFFGFFAQHREYREREKESERKKENKPYQSFMNLPHCVDCFSIQLFDSYIVVATFISSIVRPRQ